MDSLNKDVIKVEDLINGLKNRWQLIVIITLITTIVASAVSFFKIKPKYQASTKLFIGKEGSAATDDDEYSNNDVQMYQKLMKTYADIVISKDFVREALRGTEIKASISGVLGSLAVTPKNDTQILVISYTSIDKNQTKEVVEAIANQFIKSSKALIPNSNVQIVESVSLPSGPISPNVKLTIMAAIVIGAILGIGLALMLEFVNNTVKEKRQLENMLDIPVLGTIPNNYTNN